MKRPGDAVGGRNQGIAGDQVGRIGKAFQADLHVIGSCVDPGQPGIESVDQLQVFAFRLGQTHADLVADHLADGGVDRSGGAGVLRGVGLGGVDDRLVDAHRVDDGDRSRIGGVIVVFLSGIRGVAGPLHADGGGGISGKVGVRTETGGWIETAVAGIGDGAGQAGIFNVGVVGDNGIGAQTVVDPHCDLDGGTCAHRQLAPEGADGALGSGSGIEDEASDIGSDSSEVNQRSGDVGNIVGQDVFEGDIVSLGRAAPDVVVGDHDPVGDFVGALDRGHAADDGFGNGDRRLDDADALRILHHLVGAVQRPADLRVVPKGIPAVIVAVIQDHGPVAEGDGLVDGVVGVAVGQGAETAARLTVETQGHGAGVGVIEGADIDLQVAQAAGQGGGDGHAVESDKGHPVGQVVDHAGVPHLALGHDDGNFVGYDLADGNLALAIHVVGVVVGSVDDGFAERRTGHLDSGVVGQFAGIGMIGPSFAGGVGLDLGHIRQDLQGVDRVPHHEIVGDHHQVAAAGGTGGFERALLRRGIGQFQGRGEKVAGEGGGSAVPVGHPEVRAASGNGESGGDTIGDRDIEGAVLAGPGVLDHHEKCHQIAGVNVGQVGVDGPGVESVGVDGSVECGCGTGRVENHPGRSDRCGKGSLGIGDGRHALGDFQLGLNEDDLGDLVGFDHDAGRVLFGRSHLVGKEEAVGVISVDHRHGDQQFHLSGTRVVAVAGMVAADVNDESVGAGVGDLVDGGVDADGGSIARKIVNSAVARLVRTPRTDEGIVGSPTDPSGLGEGSDRIVVVDLGIVEAGYVEDRQRQEILESQVFEFRKRQPIDDPVGDEVAGGDADHRLRHGIAVVVEGNDVAVAVDAFDYFGEAARGNGNRCAGVVGHGGLRGKGGDVAIGAGNHDGIGQAVALADLFLGAADVGFPHLDAEGDGALGGPAIVGAEIGGQDAGAWDEPAAERIAGADESAVDQLLINVEANVGGAVGILRPGEVGGGEIDGDAGAVHLKG